MKGGWERFEKCPECRSGDISCDRCGEETPREGYLEMECDTWLCSACYEEEFEDISEIEVEDLG